jgi:cell division protein FtsB
MKRLGLTLLALAAISAIAYYVFTHPSLDRAEHLQGEVDKLREQNRELADKNERLEEKVVALRDDPRLAERKARESSGLARPGEVVFQFDEPEEAVEVSVRLEVGPDGMQLAGRALSIDELADRLAGLEDDVPNARLRVRFDEEIDTLERQQVRDIVAESHLAPADYAGD